jgi:hypothetical protein
MNCDHCKYYYLHHYRSLLLVECENRYANMDACVCAAGITRLPVLEGEISHIEIPRVATNLGITIVGGADTALVSSNPLV